jgi:hypothetical protein
MKKSTSSKVYEHNTNDSSWSQPLYRWPTKIIQLGTPILAMTESAWKEMDINSSKVYSRSYTTTFQLEDNHKSWTSLYKLQSFTNIHLVPFCLQVQLCFIGINASINYTMGPMIRVLVLGSTTLRTTFSVVYSNTNTLNIL